MNCRPDCGACCTAPSISSPIPGMPEGKRAGQPCVQLGEDARCLIFDQPTRPQVCAGLKPSVEMCGDGPAHALHYLARLEALTQPGAQG